MDVLKITEEWICFCLNQTVSRHLRRRHEAGAGIPSDNGELQCSVCCQVLREASSAVS